MRKKKNGKKWELNKIIFLNSSIRLTEQNKTNGKKMQLQQQQQQLKIENYLDIDCKTL